MNNKQKKVILVAVAVIILMSLFPPWVHITYSRVGPLSYPRGYGFVFLPPATTKAYTSYDSPGIDFSRLFLQWFIVALAAGGLVFMFKDR